jgi:hypothetical protein
MSLTQLEMRLAPATLMSATDVTYLDEHDQTVDVHISAGVFNSGNVNEVFTFKSGNNGTQQLQEIDLTQLTNPSAASGATLTITVTSPGTAQQPIEVGLINAPGIDLGAVQVNGDLGAINAGAADTNPGLASLTVESMGQYGTATQPPGGSLVSTIQGPLGALTVSAPKGSTGTGNIDGEFINVNGTIGSVTVTGSLIGGKGDYSGEISASGDVGAVTVGGALEGGAGFGTGEIFAGGNLGQVQIGGNVMGSGGNASGSIIANGSLTGVTVGGALEGGAGDYSGEIGSDVAPFPVLTTGNVGPVQIDGNVMGSGGNDSGTIYAGGNLASVTVGGALDGGAGDYSGAIFAIGNITGQVTIGKGVQGSSGLYSGSITADGTLAATSSVTVGGALSGGTGDSSGEIVASDALGQVQIGGGVQGSTGDGSGEVGSFGGNVAGVTVDGSLVGGAGGDSGEIFADSGVLGPVQITGNLQGGSVSGHQSLAGSGFIFGARITSVSITGSVIAGQNTGTGRLTDSGAISAIYDIGPITVGSLVGNSKNPVVISARGQQSPTTTDLAIASITVGSSKVSGSVSFTNILAGYTPTGTGVNAAAQIGPVTVHGNWTASNLVAGAAPGHDGQFGTADDVALKSSDAHDAISQIGPIIITGTVSGNSANRAANYGFVAQEVTSLTVDGKPITLKPAIVTVSASPSAGTVTVNEV